MYRPFNMNDMENRQRTVTGRIDLPCSGRDLPGRSAGRAKRSGKVLG
jgi:hypothetical protein